MLSLSGEGRAGKRGGQGEERSQNMLKISFLNNTLPLPPPKGDIVLQCYCYNKNIASNNWNIYK